MRGGLASTTISLARTHAAASRSKRFARRLEPPVVAETARPDATGLRRDSLHRRAAVRVQAPAALAKVANSKLLSPDGGRLRCSVGKQCEKLAALFLVLAALGLCGPFIFKKLFKRACSSGATPAADEVGAERN